MDNKKTKIQHLKNSQSLLPAYLHYWTISFILITISLIISVTRPAIANDTDLIEAAEKELNRNFESLTKQPVPPYFMSYEITDTRTVKLTASFGKIKLDQDIHNRILDVDIRVGDHKFDNTHIIRGNPFNFSFGFGAMQLPLEGDEEALRQSIWYATDRYYKNALEKYEKAAKLLAEIRNETQ